MRLCIRLLMLPFRILAGLAEFFLRVMCVIIGFIYRALGFFSGRAAAVIMGLIIAFFLGRKHLRRECFSGKRR